MEPIEKKYNIAIAILEENANSIVHSILFSNPIDHFVCIQMVKEV